MLTKETYFSDDSYTHSHQLTTWLKDKYLYKLRHIDKNPEYEFNRTDAVIKGTIVDEALTEGSTRYTPAVLKRDDPELYAEQKENPEFVATPAVWRDAQMIIEQLPKHPIFQMLKEKGKPQHIVEGDIAGTKMAGKIDWLVPGVGIFDLKVSNQMVAKDERSWMYHCGRMRYGVPAFVYRILEGDSLPFFHLVCWLEDKILKVKLYRLPEEMIDKGGQDTIRAIGGIKAQDFEPELVSLEDAIDIPWITDEICPQEEGDEF